MKKTSTPTISIIIPNYNDAETLPACLQAACASSYAAVEIIVVDDGSTDNSAEVIKEYPVTLIEHPHNKGQGAARNTGSREAQGEVLIFIDSDICIKKDTVDHIAKLFQKQNTTHAVVGIIEGSSSFSNIASIHFNHRIRYEYLKLPEHINIFYGSIGAIKKDVFVAVGGFNEQIRGVEDSELGLRLFDNGYTIIHDKTLTVIHEKHITITEIFKNDFNRTVDRMKLLFGKRLFSSIIKTKRFITSPLSHLCNPLIAFFFFIFIIASLWCPSLLILSVIHLVLFWWINKEYISDLALRHSRIQVVLIFILLLVDMLVVFFGLLNGLIWVIKGEHY